MGAIYDRREMKALGRRAELGHVMNYRTLFTLLYAYDCLPAFGVYVHHAYIESEHLSSNPSTYT